MAGITHDCLDQVCALVFVAVANWLPKYCEDAIFDRLFSSEADVWLIYFSDGWMDERIVFDLDLALHGKNALLRRGPTKSVGCF